MKKKTTQSTTLAAPTNDVAKQAAPKSKTLLYFVLKFAVLFLFFEACYFNDYLYKNLFVPVNELFAFLAAKILTFIGLPSTSSGDTISNNTFSIGVKQGCDSLEALAIFVCGVIAFPSKMRIKLYGLLIGSSIILFINLIRLVHLFWIGLRHRELFDLFHLEIWQAFFIVLSIVLWVLWVIRAVKPSNTLQHDS